MGKLTNHGFQKSPPDYLQGPSIIYGANLRKPTKPKSPVRKKRGPAVSKDKPKKEE